MRLFKACGLSVIAVMGFAINQTNAQTIDIGSPTQGSGLRIFGRDSVHYYMPLQISGNIQGQTFGNSPSQTLGRLVRFNQGPDINNGANFYDLGIGQDTSLFITNHTIPPVVGNGTIRKRMFVISTDDRVGINLGPTSKPTATFHSDGTVRFQNLPTTATALTKVIMTDDAGNLYWKEGLVSGDPGNAWLLTGNTGTNPSLNFMGTNDNNPVVFKANGIERMRIQVGTLRGVDIGTPAINNELRIYGRDSVHYTIPIIVTGNIQNQTFGNTPGQTQGRLVRFNQGPNAANGGPNFYDLGIGQDSSLYITNHTIPPVVGNGVIRKRMIVISTDDRVGINLGPTAKPTANLHSDGTARLENLPTTATTLNKVIMTDDAGNLYWKDKSAVSGAGSDWTLTGNAGTNAATNFIGTTDNNAFVIKSNGIERMRVQVGTFRGVDIGTEAVNNELRIYGRDSVGFTIPLIVAGKIQNQTFGNNLGQTMGRLIRLNQGPAQSNSGSNFYDIGIGQDSSFFITNHTIPPVVGNGFIRKRMIVISNEDKVGINLGPAAKPTANLHNDGTVRFENLPSGAGNVLVVDANGNVFKSSAIQNRQADASAERITALEKELKDLKEELKAIKSAISAQAQR